MKNHTIYFLSIYILFFSFPTSAFSMYIINEDYRSSQPLTDEIVFYSNGSKFSPVIVIEGDAQILWTWDDGSTSNSAKPIKNYGTSKLRKNSLKVTPWSAVRRINIGYDAEDGGSPDIEFVSNQFVSEVENIALVAPYLKEWCSSHNNLTSLDFSNFVNLEVIESHLSQSLQSVSLINTPKLKRVNFVINRLKTLDLTDNTNMEEILVGDNNLITLILPEHADNLWYIGCRENHLLDNQFIVNNLDKYPNISHLSFWNSNQKGDFVMSKSNLTKFVWIRSYGNQYNSIDFRGSLKILGSIGHVDFSNNKLTNVELAGCCQIRTLNLSNNLLTSEDIDYILNDLNEFRNETDYGGEIQARTADLTGNNPPSELGLQLKKELEAKGWTIKIDLPTNINIVNNKDFRIYPNPSNDRFKLHINEIPKEGALIEILNVTGQILMEKRIYENDIELSIGQFTGRTFFIKLISNHVHATQKITKLS